jgi:nucleotide-binding universal stress UspA family protein
LAGQGALAKSAPKGIVRHFSRICRQLRSHALCREEVLMSTVAEVCPRETGTGFKQILVATDFSETAQRALNYALAIARRYGSAVSVLHAIPPEPRAPIPMEPLPLELNRRALKVEEQMKQLGQKTQAEAPWIGDLKCEWELEQGPVWDVLSQAIEHDHTDLLVLGTHGRGGLKKVALGSVAEEVLHRAHCPVLTIGPHAASAGPAPVEFKRILFATDFGPASAKAFLHALSLAEDCHAKLFLLHMMPPIPNPDLGPGAYGTPIFGVEPLLRWQQQTQQESLRKLKDLIPSNARLVAEPEVIVEMDFLPEGILNTAALHKIDLIVLGANRTASPWVAAHTPWSLTHDVLSHAKCPVLTMGE